MFVGVTICHTQVAGKTRGEAVYCLVIFDNFKIALHLWCMNEIINSTVFDFLNVL